MPALLEPSRLDAALEARINHARQQVRTADLSVAILGLVALTFGFGLIMLLLDRWLELSVVARQAALAGYLVAAGAYVVKVLRRPFVETINPYYAARQVERTLPEAKNSLVSWLDLRDAELPASVRDAVSRRAASDLDRADVEEAVRDSRLSRYGSIVGVLAVGLIVLLCVFRPTQFFSLLARTFAPFTSTAIAHRTNITILEPAGGDITVPINYSVDVKVDIDGRIPGDDEPDALRLKFRYSDGDPVWEEKRLEPTDRSGERKVRVPAAQVRNGFEYQVTGGDAATPIYRVRVRAKALFTDFEVNYRYRPYLHFADDVRADPNLQSFRGTDVTLLAKANRPVSQGLMVFKPMAAGGKEEAITAQLLPDRPDTLQFKLTLKESGQYRLSFVAADQEKSDPSLPYEVHVLPDNPPEVIVTHSAIEQMPANGTLTLTARVTDDFGLTSARLVMSKKDNAVAPAEPLSPVVYNGSKPLRNMDGRDPGVIVAKEVVALDQLKDAAGNKIELRPGMVITYRYEARDNCDFPEPQTGSSSEYAVTLVEPQAQDKRDAERQEANQEKKEHDQKQQTDGNNGQPPDANNQGQDGQPHSDEPMNPQDQQTIDQAKRIADELNKNNKSKAGDGNDGQGQPDQDSNKPGHHQKTKPGGEAPSKPNDSAGSTDQPKAGEGKDKGSENKPGAGQQDKNKSDQPMKPNEGAGDQRNTEAGEGKEKNRENKPGDAKPETNKAGEPNKPQNEPGEKGGAGGEQSKPAGESKPEPMNQPGAQRDENNKLAGEQNKPGDNKSQPANKTSDTPEKKNANDKTEKSGEKPGMGAKEDKPNDTTPQTSPDKGNADKGKDGSQRAGEGQKDDNKNEKAKDSAMSGKADPKAGKPEGSKPQGSNDQGNKQPNVGESTKPEAGGATKPAEQGDKSKAQSIQDANKPHDKSGEKATMEPKSKGADGKPPTSGEKSDQKNADAKGQPGEAKPTNGDTKPKDIQKLIENFKNADDKNRELIMKQLEEQAKKAPTDERKKAYDEAIKECKDCNKPGSNGNKPKASGKAVGDAKSDKPGQGQGNEPNQSNDNAAPKSGDGKPKPPDIHNHDAKSDGESKPDPNGKPGEKDRPKSGDRPKDKSKAVEPSNGPANAGGKRDGEADFRPDEGPAPEPNKKFLREAGEMQLRQFKEIKDNTKALEELKMSKEEYEAFLRSYENLVKRSIDAMKPGADDRKRGAATGGSTANSGAKKVENNSKSGPQTNRGGRGQAPPEFRDQYKEFTEEQAKQARTKDK